MKRQKTCQQKKKLRRRLGCEALEPRHLMAADAFEMLDQIATSEGSADLLFAASDASGQDLGSIGLRCGHVMGSYAHIICEAP